MAKHNQEEHSALPSPYGEGNDYHAGIRVGEEGFYDPTAGYNKPKNQKPAPSSNTQPRKSVSDPTPVGSGESDETTLQRARGGLNERTRNTPGADGGLDSKSETAVESRPSGRKAKSDNSGN